MATVTISVKMILPAVDYGTLTYEATWQDDVDATQVDRSALVIETTKRLHNDLAMTALPLINSEVDRFAVLLLKDDNPEYGMRQRSKIYQAFRIMNPDVIIPAMQAILASKSVNRGAGSLKNFDDNAIAQTPLWDK